MALADSSLPLVLYWLGAVVTFAGCTHRPHAVAAASHDQPVVSATRLAGAVSVQTDPAYRQAERLYAAKDYPGAQRIIARLLAAPNISVPDRDFLTRQQRILYRAGSTRSLVNSQPSAHPAPSSFLHAVGRTPGSSLSDCGPRALALACAKLGVKADVRRLMKLAGTTERGSSLEGLARAARAVGLKAEGVQVNRLALGELKTPAIIWLNGNHYAAVLAKTTGGLKIRDPNKPNEEVVSTDSIYKRSAGILLKLSRK